ncbi:uncharacterized protein LOC130666100 [Microplitis mediator]|uniref:uncharacterized protein LOC130666100 n=1 Tax=Microplitis mediator TaxID=375433 RepID=UPI002552BB68|nr:uncharacterized protein LOC130666100 [Microplitis mediator]XP_057322762.1 uncharacterized protein LOC130666100 [Microplitis mediator]
MDTPTYGHNPVELMPGKKKNLLQIDDFWLISTLHSYNYLNNRFIIFNCQCYHRHYDPIDFYENIFIKKQSYFACIISNDDSRIRHMCFPIMLGSMIDLHLRPQHELDPDVFGCFIINGSLKILPNFQTNNLNSLHIYSYKDERCVRWVVKTNSNTCRLYYSTVKSEQVLCEFTETSNSANTSTDDDCFFSFLEFDKNDHSDTNRKKNLNGLQKDNDNWIDFINRVNPYKCNDITVDKYIDVFQLLLQDYPQIDDLANKTIITAPMILYRVVTMTKHTKLKQIFESGNLFYVLSKKKHMTLIKDFANMYLNIEGQKHDKIRYMLDLTKRSINRQTRNSKALLYPRDADYFICYLTCKEMKDAGETISFAHYVTITLPINDRLIQQEIFQSHDYDTPHGLRIIINGFLTNCYVDNSLDSLISFKRRLPMITFFRLGNRYLFTYTKGYVLVKYSSKYNIFVTPYEAQNLFPDCFDNYSQFSRFGCFARQLSSSILKTPPPKCTVTINNIRGACNVLNSRFKAQAFLTSIGYNSAIIYQRHGENELLSSHKKYSRISLCKKDDTGGGDKLLPIARETHIAFAWLKYAERFDIKPKNQSIINSYFEELDATILKSKQSAIPRDGSEFYGVITAMIDPNADASNEFYLQFLKNVLPIKYIFIDNRFSLIMNNDENEVNLLHRATVKTITNIPEYKQYLWTLISNDNMVIPLYNYTPSTLGSNDKIFSYSPEIPSGSQKEPPQKRKYNRNSYTITAPQKPCSKSSKTKRIQNSSMFKSMEIITDCKDYYNLYTTKLFNILCCNDYTDRNTNQLVLYCAFGDVGGGCIEDGIILDETFVSNAPNKLISVTLAVKFMTHDSGYNGNDNKSNNFPKNQSEKPNPSEENEININAPQKNRRTSSKSSQSLNIKYSPINREIDKCLIFGVISSNQRLLTFKSKNVNIVETNLKTHNFYVIYCVEFTHYKKTIESYYNESTNTLIIHYRYMRPIGIDMKFCNKHGQKAIVSCVRDLSYYRAWTKSGKCIHPQVLYSMQSVIGRMAAGQVHEMLSNEECGFSENGEVVAPMSFVIHSVESSVKSKITAALRIDLMTQQNGFDANMCTGLALLATTQHAGNFTDSYARLHYLKELFKLNGINFEFL